MTKVVQVSCAGAVMGLFGCILSKLVVAIVTIHTYIYIKFGKVQTRAAPHRVS